MKRKRTRLAEKTFHENEMSRIESNFVMRGELFSYTLPIKEHTRYAPLFSKKYVKGISNKDIIINATVNKLLICKRIVKISKKTIVFL